MVYDAEKQYQRKMGTQRIKYPHNSYIKQDAGSNLESSAHSTNGKEELNISGNVKSDSCESAG